MTRAFLALIGFAYIVLAAWCAAALGSTSRAVGFTLQPGSGESEFLAVYGGLELALGIVFLRPLWRPEETGFALRLCAILHGCLILFRTAGFFLFTGFETTTYFLAAVEWAIGLPAIILWTMSSKQRGIAESNDIG